jgi:hypothetical protein
MGGRPAAAPILRTEIPRSWAARIARSRARELRRWARASSRIRASRRTSAAGTLEGRLAKIPAPSAQGPPAVFARPGTPASSGRVARPPVALLLVCELVQTIPQVDEGPPGNGRRHSAELR